MGPTDKGTSGDLHTSVTLPSRVVSAPDPTDNVAIKFFVALEINEYILDHVSGQKP